MKHEPQEEPFLEVRGKVPYPDNPELELQSGGWRNHGRFDSLAYDLVIVDEDQPIEPSGDGEEGVATVASTGGDGAAKEVVAAGLGLVVGLGAAWAVGRYGPPAIAWAEREALPRAQELWANACSLQPLRRWSTLGHPKALPLELKPGPAGPEPLLSAAIEPELEPTSDPKPPSPEAFSWPAP